jgi:Big-like domain-containing protein
MRRTLAPLLISIALASCGSGSDTTSPPPPPPGPPPIKSVSLSSASATLIAPATAQVTAIAKDSAGNTLTGRAITWNATPARVASISATGVVTGVAAGVATVTATSEGISGTLAIAVGEATTIGAGGGAVTTSDGVVQLTFPAGALQGPAVVTATPFTDVATNPLMVPGTAFDLGPSGTQFPTPVTLTMKYDPAQLGTIEPTYLGIFTYTGGAWHHVGGTLDTASHIVSAPLAHFSRYVACQFPCGADFPQVFGGFLPFEYTLKQGGHYTLPGHMQRRNYGGEISYSIVGLPAGLTIRFSQGAWSSDAAPLTADVTVAANTPAGFYIVDFHADAPGMDPNPTSQLLLHVEGASIGIVPAPAALTIAQGDVAASNLTLDHNGVSGPIGLSITGLPNGVTASFNPQNATANSSILTLTATATAQLGTSTATIHGVNPSVPTADVLFPITVTASSGFTLTPTPAFASLVPGGSSSTGIKVTRAGSFNGAITFGVSGLPGGLTGVVSPTSVTDSLQLLLTATGAVSPGSYVATITGTSAGKSSGTTVLVTVGSAGTATVSMDLSTCSAAGNSVWVAYQDGSSAFTRVAPSGGIYSFPISTGKGAVAVAVTNSSSTTVYVNYGIPAELPLQNLCFTTGTKTATVSVANLQPNDEAAVTMGSNTLVLSPSVPSYHLDEIPDGLIDIVAWRYDHITPGVDVRGIIRRDQTIPTGATVPVLDFASGESFAPAVAAVGYSGINGEPASLQVLYHTGGRCDNGAALGNYGVGVSALYGVPAAVQRTPDLHEIQVGTPTRFASKFFHTLSSQTITLGSTLGTPQITELGGPYRRLQVILTLPTDYSFADYGYSDGSRSIELSGNTGYFGSHAMTLIMPDLSAVPGFDPAWVPASGSHGAYRFSGQSRQVPVCSDGGSYTSGRMSGTN